MDNRFHKNQTVTTRKVEFTSVIVSFSTRPEIYAFEVDNLLAKQAGSS